MLSSPRSNRDSGSHEERDLPSEGRAGVFTEIFKNLRVLIDLTFSGCVKKSEIEPVDFLINMQKYDEALKALTKLLTRTQQAERMLQSKGEETTAMLENGYQSGFIVPPIEIQRRIEYVRFLQSQESVRTAA